jgi:CspA family cold shock protein
MTHAPGDNPGKKGVDMETMRDDSIRQESVLTGIVKWFNPGKGYGFIAPDTGGNDIFVHISAVQHAGLRKLNEGERVRFALQQREGRVAAIGIERAN